MESAQKERSYLLLRTIGSELSPLEAVDSDIITATSQTYKNIPYSLGTSSLVHGPVVDHSPMSSAPWWLGHVGTGARALLPSTRQVLPALEQTGQAQPQLFWLQSDLLPMEICFIWNWATLRGTLRTTALDYLPEIPELTRKNLPVFVKYFVSLGAGCLIYATGFR